MVLRQKEAVRGYRSRRLVGSPGRKTRKRAASEGGKQKEAAGGYFIEVEG